LAIPAVVTLLIEEYPTNVHETRYKIPVV